MPSVYQLKANSTAGDRFLGNVLIKDAIHLSDGSVAMVVYDPAAGAPNKLSLQVLTGPRTSVAWSFTLSTDTFWTSSEIALCRDAADNLTVIGTYAGDLDNIGAQRFNKGSGLTWTAATFIQGDTANSEGLQFGPSMSTVWCNTGGGLSAGGHILVGSATANSLSFYWVLDATKISSGLSSFIVSSGRSPAFLGGWGGGSTGIDLSPDGFGATSGLAISAASATQVKLAGWGVTGAGALTAGAGLSDTQSATSLAAASKLRLLRWASGQWLAIYPRAATPYTQLTCRGYSASAMINSVDTGTPTNFPLPGQTGYWDAIADPANSQVWILGWHTTTGTTLLRLPIVCTPLNSGSPPTVGAPVTEATGVTTNPAGSTSNTNTTLRSVKQPVDVLHSDWQAYTDSNSGGTHTYALLGGFSALTVAPNPPTLVSPASGTVANFAGSTVTFVWQFSSQMTGDAQTGFYFRRLKQDGLSAYEYWNGSAWVGSPFKIVSASQSLAFTAGTGTWTAGQTYTWAVQTHGVNPPDLDSGFSGEWYVVAANPPPPIPVLSVSRDNSIYRTSISLAKGAADGSGGNGASIAYSLELSDDGGVTWSFRRGSSSRTDFATTLYDYDTASGVSRQYRARTWTAYPTSYSLYHTQTAAAASITTFWLADISAGAPGITVKVLKGSLSTLYPARAAVHIGLGRAEEIVIEDTLGLESGQCTIFTLSAAEETAVLALLNSQHTLLLQVPDGRQFFCRIVSDRTVDQNGALAIPGAYRQHSISFRGQARPQ